MSALAVSSVAEDFGNADYKSFESRAQLKLGIRLQDYKSDQMQRRLATLARRTGAKSFMDYLSRLDRDAVLMQGFLDEVTINVTELMRNPGLFEQFVKDMLPSIRKKGSPFSAWSAGCSYGAEAYTLAMLLHEADPQSPFRIQGTDIDFSVLTRANSANFTEADMRNVSPERRKTHFHQVIEGRFSPALHLKKNISFSQHDLLGDSYPKATHDLIMCRNVVIYFTDEAKERIYKGFYSALKPGGILFVGGSERLANHDQLGFEPICPFFYRRPF